jgi:ribose 5-phosphate isomerase A
MPAEWRAFFFSGTANGVSPDRYTGDLLGDMEWRAMGMDQDEKKRAAALAALEFIEPGTRLGVGTGSTVNHLIRALPDVAGNIEVTVASSVATESLLRAAGVEVAELNDVGEIDLYIDGADEVNKQFHLIKGGGGALTREKILAGAARRFVCIVDESKRVGVLGSFPLPVEVIPMAEAFVARQFVKVRGQPVLRPDYRTDNGNSILDVHNLSITNPPEMEQRFNKVPGVVSVGIFAQRPADVLLIAGAQGVERRDRA